MIDGVKNKIRVFLSSKCGVNSYDKVREKLVKSLEKTGMIDVYTFEGAAASSLSAIDAYLSELEDSHIILFLLDNENTLIPAGVMKEWQLARKQKKKCIYIFCNNPDKPATSIQDEIIGPSGEKFKIVDDIYDFLDVGYKSIVDDVVKIYKEYCNSRLDYKERDVADENNEEVSVDSITFKNQLIIEKSIFNTFTKTNHYFSALNKYNTTDVVDQNINNDFDTRLFNFAKILLCEEKFNDDIVNSLIESIIDFQTSEQIKNIVQIRWRAIKYIYHDNIKEAINSLEEAYEFALINDLDEWLKSDILIDIRNLKNQLMNNSNSFCENDAQKRLDSNCEILYFPVIDRISKSINENIIKEIGKVTNKSPYTVSFGTDLNNNLKYISEYYIVAAIYGSWTYLKEVIELLKKVFYNFGNAYDVDEWRTLSLKYSIVSNDSKSLEEIAERNNGIISACSFEKINELYKQINNFPTTPERTLLKIRVFKALGNYFSDDVYRDIENEIIIILKKWTYSDKPIVSWMNEVFKSINKNIFRLNSDKIAIVLIDLLKMKYFRFADESFKIISRLNMDKINGSNKAELLELVIELIRNKDVINNCNNFKQLIITIRKSEIENNKILDEILKEFWSEFYNNEYLLEISNEENIYLDFVNRCIDDLKNRNLTQGKNGCYSGYMSYPLDRIKYFIEVTNIEIEDQMIISELIGVIKECLNSKTQLYGEKISCLRFILFINNKINTTVLKNELINLVSNLILDEITEGRGDILFDKNTELTLVFNYLLVRMEVLNCDSVDMLECISGFHNGESIEYIYYLQGLDNYFKYSQYKSNNKEIELLLIFSMNSMIVSDDFEVRLEAVNTLFSLYKRSNKKIALRLINMLVNDMDYRVKVSILSKINKLENDDILSFISIFDKLRVDNNYIVRTYSNQLIEKLN